MQDFRGYIIEGLRKFIKLFNVIFFTRTHYLKCYLFNIKIGKKCSFFGKTLLVRRHESKIIIGDNVCFRSSTIYNQFGLMRRNSICTLKKEALIRIGSNVGLSGCAISSYKKIVIEDNVLIGANVTISDFDWHGIEDRDEPSFKEIKIERNSWIGANSIILKGIIIGENSIIGAGSIVTKNIPPNCIAGGNPCKVIRYLK